MTSNMEGGEKFDAKFLEAVDSPIDYSKMDAAESSKYSSDLPHQVDQLVKFIGKIEPKFVDKTQKLHILDGTAHVGSFSLCWAALFRKQKITSVEINKDIYARLKKNTKNLGLSEQVEVINSDINDYIEATNEVKKYDFIYLDPPWGGPNYRFKKGVMLYLGKKTVVEVILEIFKKRLTEQIFLKVPINFDFQSMPFAYTVFTVMGARPNKLYPDYLLVCISRYTRD